MGFSKATTISVYLRESSLTMLAATIRSTKYMLKPEDVTGGGGKREDNFADGRKN
jgi:hypothetical protein